MADGRSFAQTRVSQQYIVERAASPWIGAPDAGRDSKGLREVRIGRIEEGRKSGCVVVYGIVASLSELKQAAAVPQPAAVLRAGILVVNPVVIYDRER